MQGKKISQEIAVLKTGRYTDMTGRVYDITQQILEDIAAHTPKNSTPLVKGHPASDAPAMGWVEKLSASRGILWAKFRDINPEFAEEVKAEAFKNVSASFYLPFTQGNPKQGHYCLRHVGALGASRPAIPELGTLQEALAFASTEELMTVFSENTGEEKHHFWQASKEIFKNSKNMGQRILEEAEKLEKDRVISFKQKEALITKMKQMVLAGLALEEAAADFAEFFPEKQLYSGGRLRGLNHGYSYKGTAEFCGEDSPLEYGEVFAKKKAELEKQGMSAEKAYKEAKKFCEGTAE